MAQNAGVTVAARTARLERGRPARQPRHVRVPRFLPPGETPDGLRAGRPRSTNIGTSGYSYKEWKGTFYPEDVQTGRAQSSSSPHTPPSHKPA